MYEKLLALLLPYSKAELPAVRWCEYRDVVIFIHPNYPPYILRPTSPGSWELIQLIVEGE